MGRKGRTPEQIIRHLRQAEVLSSQGKSVSEICREIGVTENTYYRWRKEYRGMGVDQARRLKELERENTRLKRITAGYIIRLAKKVMNYSGVQSMKKEGFLSKRYYRTLHWIAKSPAMITKNRLNC